MPVAGFGGGAFCWDPRTLCWGQLSQVQVGDVSIFWKCSFCFVALRLPGGQAGYLMYYTRNQMLVTFDWLKSSLFGRDMTSLLYVYAFEQCYTS